MTKNAVLKAYIHTNNTYKNFFFLFFVFLVTTFLLAYNLLFRNEETRTFQKINLNLDHQNEVIVRKEQVTIARNPKCTHWDCFNIYKCGRTGHDRIAVYVYPLVKYVDENGVPISEQISKEYFMLLQSIIDSKYYTADPYEACLFVPSIDTLNQDHLRLNLTSKALNSLPYWSDGENHLIFNMISGTAPDFSPVLELDIGKALLAGSGFNSYTFRERFDISIPTFSPVSNLIRQKATKHKRSWLVTSSQLSIDPNFLGELQKISYQNLNTVLILDACHDHNYTSRCEIITGKYYSYPEVLLQSKFCTVFRGERISQFVLLEAMAANCIPVFVMDSAILPFQNVIDWKHMAVFIMEDYLHTLLDVLNNISNEKIKQMQRTLEHVYSKYFSSIEKIALTTLDVLQDRVYTNWARNYDDFNLLPGEENTNPFYFPITAPRSAGFTAVILTYDRVESLFTLIERLSRVPSLMKVLVVWNNQKKSPPPLSQFPQITKPIRVIRTKANKLSNRFYHYKEIETEAVLHIDDDIVMLTSDEIEFAYEVWREFPDRIVGFPSRLHTWDNVTNSWKYESEWTNEISMVLTGAAFLHKYWSYLYTTAMSSELKDWVDEHMNCEDIAMNFLVANYTNKAPIKVTPRKKFKCPECVNNEMLSADLGHMVERSQCIDRFTKAFGRMPLQSVEFRADPVLFKDSFPEKLKRFNDIGSL